MVALLVLAACAGDYYYTGMPREEAYDRIDSLEFRPLSSETRLGAQHDLIVVPEAGFPQQYDPAALAADRQQFARVKSTDSRSAEQNRWARTMIAVETWHGLIFRDFELVEIIDDEDHDRLLLRVAYWMQDNVDPDFDAQSLDPLKLNLDQN